MRALPLITAAVLLVAAASAAAAGPPAAAVRGRAFGARVDVQSVTQPPKTLAPVAPEAFPCAPFGDASYANQADSSLVPGPGLGTVEQTGSLVQGGSDTLGPGTTDLVQRSTVTDISLLGGYIQADAVTATSHATLDAAHPATPDFHLEAADPVRTATHLVNLRVNGQSFSSLGPNSVVLLGTFGKLIVDERKFNADRTFEQTNALHVVVKDYGGYSGDVIIGSASTGLQPVAATLEASAFGLSADTGDPATDVAPQASAPVGCAGGAATASQPAFSSPAIGSTGPLLSGADGTVAPGASDAAGTAQVHAVDLFGGRITADLAEAHASATQDATGVHADATGTAVTNLVVDGQPISGLPPPNTQIPLSGIGTLTVNRQECLADGQWYAVTATRPCAGLDRARLVTDVLYVQGAPSVRVAEARAGLRG